VLHPVQQVLAQRAPPVQQAVLPEQQALAQMPTLRGRV